MRILRRVTWFSGKRKGGGWVSSRLENIKGGLYKIASEGREENITKPYWESDKFDRDTAKILCTPSPTSPCVLK